MGSYLHIIANSKLTNKGDFKMWNKIVSQLNDLDLDTYSVHDAKEVRKLAKEEWKYKIDDEYIEEYPESFNVYFYGPYTLCPELYTHITRISSFYKFGDLLDMFNKDSFHSFRKTLYQIITILGGTEVIYLAEERYGRISSILQEDVWEYVPYEAIKSKMYLEIGEPLKDFRLLTLREVRKQNPKDEFFILDDFKDIRRKEARKIFSHIMPKPYTQKCFFRSDRQGSFLWAFLENEIESSLIYITDLLFEYEYEWSYHRTRELNAQYWFVRYLIERDGSALLVSEDQDIFRDEQHYELVEIRITDYESFELSNFFNRWELRIYNKSKIVERFYQFLKIEDAKYEENGLIQLLSEEKGRKDFVD